MKAMTATAATTAMTIATVLLVPLLTLLTAVRRNPINLDDAFVLTARDVEHALQVGQGIRFSLFLEATLFRLLGTLCNALALELVHVFHVNGVEHVVALLKNAGHIHIGHVLQHRLGQRHHQRILALLIPRGRAQVNGRLDSAGIAISKAVLRKGNLDKVEQLVLVACLLDNSVILRRCDQLIAVNNAAHDHRHIDG